jgi:subtilisin family serine protease
MRGLGAALSILAVLGFSGAVSSSHASEPSSYVPGELLVRFASSTTAAARADVLRDLDAAVVERLPLKGVVRVRLDPGTSVAEAEAAFERRPEVRYAQPNHLYSFSRTPNDPDLSDLWGLHNTGQSVNSLPGGTPDADIDAPEAWDTNTGSPAVTVAVVDSGVDHTHPDLAANMWSNPGETTNGADDDGNGKIDDVRGWDFIDNDAVPDDGVEHGTHVAGTIGAKGDNGAGGTGVNWTVRLMALKVGDDNGLPDDAIAQGFAYACAKGARIVNGSFGGSGFSQLLLDAVNACPGALFVFAAGNNATNNDAQPKYPCSYGSPNIICVAASDATDARAWFSNYGVNAVDLAAPGENILSTIPGSYDYYDGTSMATPHVAGAAALVLAERPTLTTAELRRAVLLAAEPKPSLVGLVATGARLNVRRALTQEVTLPTVSAQSTSPSMNTWSNVNSAIASWTATDASGIDGYSFGWSPDAAFVPDEVKDVEENVTTTSTTLPDGRHWFHVRARDGAGNWSDPVHLGPFLVDTFPPTRPTLSSPTHRTGVASADRTVDINWITLGDSVSGLDGFSVAWARQQLVIVDQMKELEEGIVRTTSPTLASGAWWFGIRARDNAGNWTDTTVLGPFVVTGVTPVCTVPRLRGQTLVRAKRSLVKQGCKLGRVSKAYSRRVRRGRIVGQRPGPGLRLRRGAKIAVVVSRGRRRR